MINQDRIHKEFGSLQSIDGCLSKSEPKCKKDIIFLTKERKGDLANQIQGKSYENQIRKLRYKFVINLGENIKYVKNLKFHVIF